MEQVRQNTWLGRLLDWSLEQSASDLHGQADKPYCIRVHGRLSRVPAELFAPPSNEEIYRGLRDNFSIPACRRIEEQFETDLSFHYGRQRYRANFSKQKG